MSLYNIASYDFSPQALSRLFSLHARQHADRGSDHSAMEMEPLVQAVSARNVAGAVCGCGAAGRAHYPERVGRHQP